MSQRKVGRPPVDNPKDTRIYIRVDKHTIEKLDACVRKTDSTRSEVIRNGIDLIYDGLKE